MSEDKSETPYVRILERWTRTGGFRKVNNEPWEPIDLSLWGGTVPILFLHPAITEVTSEIREPLPSSEGTVKNEPASPDDRIWELRKMLTVIKDRGSCECDHSDENCCFVVDEYCPTCFAAVALSQDSIAASVPLKSETKGWISVGIGTPVSNRLYWIWIKPNISGQGFCRDGKWFIPDPDEDREAVNVTHYQEIVEPLKGETVPTMQNCQTCGRENPVWFAANEVWNEIVPEISGFICPICFIERAEKQGYENTGWKLVPENHAKVSETVPTEAAKPFQVRFVSQQEMLLGSIQELVDLHAKLCPDGNKCGHMEVDEAKFLLQVQWDQLGKTMNSESETVEERAHKFAESAYRILSLGDHAKLPNTFVAVLAALASSLLQEKQRRIKELEARAE